MGETKPAEAPAAKKNRRRFPKVGDFANKGLWFEAVIKQLQSQHEEWKKFGDGEGKKKLDRGRKFLEFIDDAAKDPNMGDIIKQAREKLNALEAAAKKAAAAPAKK